MNGLTGCDENIRCFIGRKPTIRQTREGRLSAFFDVSWGINQPEKSKYATWRHCIAYGPTAEIVRELKPGIYVNVSGWLTTNELKDHDGNKKTDEKGNILTDQYLVVRYISVIEREQNTEKQLCLVGGNNPEGPDQLADQKDDFPF